MDPLNYLLKNLHKLKNQQNLIIPLAVEKVNSNQEREKMFVWKNCVRCESLPAAVPTIIAPKILVVYRFIRR